MILYKHIKNSLSLLLVLTCLTLLRGCNISNKTTFEPSPAKWALEQSVGTDMVTLDYASDDTVIFHDYFGLFIYDLNELQIIRSVDLQEIDCSMTQGDDYCEVTVSNDGSTIQLHNINSEDMYLYSVNTNTFQKAKYKPMSNSFKDKLIPIETLTNNPNANLSYGAVQFGANDYGYIATYDFTIGTLDYIRNDTAYSLFSFEK
ncbi:MULTISPECIES: hypothetical protein [Clostridium]|uniref:hypothetical protein n=1 Tax=Clostridium TaxID=1485 RepID=UPI000364F462|nr:MULTISPECIES: hypothetical protein [Clostridium]MBN1035751.1 hypothetical protein [Clostridium botulinum]MBN1058893.1 hypothetical protein [Clostridium botulinum]MBN1062062.1 hypothetical protein [Clostridium botulinum]MBN1074575.1 hypothetical protein [Clostridium botulinum]MBY6932047.1 hypothetical protein [Clostridium botulinum]